MRIKNKTKQNWTFYRPVGASAGAVWLSTTWSKLHEERQRMRFCSKSPKIWARTVRCLISETEDIFASWSSPGLWSYVYLTAVLHVIKRTKGVLLQQIAEDMSASSHLFNIENWRHLRLRQVGKAILRAVLNVAIKVICRSFKQNVYETLLQNLCTKIKLLFQAKLRVRHLLQQGDKMWKIHNHFTITTESVL